MATQTQMRSRAVSFHEINMCNFTLHYHCIDNNLTHFYYSIMTNQIIISVEFIEFRETYFPIKLITSIEQIINSKFIHLK